jgi:hypothetical protein
VPENEAVRLTLPDGAKDRIESRLDELKSEQTLTPSAVAERALAAIDPSTEVTTRDNVRVAGRAAYDLVLSPRTADTLVGSVSIAVDAETGMPLRAAITARGQSTPAASVAFTELTLAAPAADLFRFSPPADADVTEKTLPDDSAQLEARSGEHDSTHETHETHGKPAVVGSGWSAVAALPAGSVPAEVSSSPLLLEATTAVTGGRALSTALFSVLLTDDGGVLAGAVPVEQLQAAAAAR